MGRIMIRFMETKISTAVINDSTIEIRKTLRA